MTRRRKFRLYLEDIVKSIEAIEIFIGKMSFNEFRKDDKPFSAVTRKIEIIGEAVKNIPYSIRDKYKNTPWKELAGFRDKLSHAYFNTDLKIIWRACKTELPVVKQLTIVI